VAATVVGAAGLGTGVLFGLQAISRRDDAVRACPTQCPDESGVLLWKDARTAANVATAAFVTGGVAVVGASILWLTGRPRGGAAPSAEVGVGPAEILVTGVW
jgi:hypothetical protein